MKVHYSATPATSAASTASPVPATSVTRDAFTTPIIDEDGFVTPYDAVSEGRPHLAIYHESFTKVEDLASKVCNDFTEIVLKLREEAGYRNDEVDYICDHNLKIYLFPRQRYPSIGPISCLGPAVSKPMGRAVKTRADTFALLQ